MNSEIVLEAKQLRKSYHKDRIEVPVLRGVDLEVRRGVVTTLVGRSGSGKSTLMHLLAALDHPDDGKIYFNGERIDNASRSRRDTYRNQNLGIIFQFYHLLPELSAIENVLAPLMINQSVLSFFRNRKLARHRAEAMLDRVGLLHRASHKPSEMSGGEMQRAAIARSLMDSHFARNEARVIQANLAAAAEQRERMAQLPPSSLASASIGSALGMAEAGVLRGGALESSLAYSSSGASCDVQRT